MSTIDERMLALERRVQALEQHTRASGANSEAIPAAGTGEELQLSRALGLVRVEIANKRFDVSNPSAGTYEDHIWFDCHYVPAALSKQTRAIKGTLEFSDHFGEVKFRVQVTVNDPLVPGRRLTQKGIGFTYNQFMEPHQWMLVTKEQDMKCALRLSNVLYADGEAEVLS